MVVVGGGVVVGENHSDSTITGSEAAEAVTTCCSVVGGGGSAWGAVRARTRLARTSLRLVGTSFSMARDYGRPHQRTQSNEIWQEAGDHSTTFVIFATVS